MNSFVIINVDSIFCSFLSVFDIKEDLIQEKFVFQYSINPFNHSILIARNIINLTRTRLNNILESFTVIYQSLIINSLFQITILFITNGINFLLSIILFSIIESFFTSIRGCSIIYHGQILFIYSSFLDKSNSA